MAITESKYKSVDIEVRAGAPLSEVCKAYDRIDQELLIAKLNAYGFDTSALTCIYSHLRGRK